MSDEEDLGGIRTNPKDFVSWGPEWASEDLGTAAPPISPLDPPQLPSLPLLPVCLDESI